LMPGWASRIERKPARTSAWSSAGFRSILEAQPGIKVVGEAADGRDAVELARLRRPAVILMDIQMPDVDGLEATRRIVAAAAPDDPVAVLMLTTFDLNEYVYEALRAGASAFLLNRFASLRMTNPVFHRALCVLCAT